MRSFLISFITFIPYLKGIFAPFKGFLYKRLFLISFSTTTLLQRDYCPIQGSFCNRPFLSFFFFYLYPHSKGLLSQSRVFFISLPSFKGIMAPFNGLFAISHFYHLFFTSTLIRRDYCPIQGSFAYLYPHSKGLLPHSRVFLQ